MNTAETIAAAIDRLERLKAESTQPTGGSSWVQGNDKKPFESTGEVYTGPLSDESGDVATWVAPADAELIVTLHATIEAQLAILRTEQHTSNVELRILALDLAEAILGARS